MRISEGIIRNWNAVGVITLAQQNMRSLLNELGAELVEAIREDMRNTPKDPSKAFWSKPLQSMHTPSAEGEYPAIMTGQLSESLEYRVEGSTLYVGINLDKKGEEGYAVYLEYGWTQEGGTFHARPYLRTTLFKHENMIKNKLGIH